MVAEPRAISPVRLTDRRAHTRFSRERHVRYRAGSWQGGAITADISRGGMSLRGPLAAPLEPGTALVLQLGDARPALLLRGSVVSVQDEVTRVAFSLLRGQAEQVTAYLEQGVVREIEHGLGRGDDSDAIAALARWYRETGRLAMALDLYRGAMDTAPRDRRFFEGMALFWVAWARTLCGDVHEWFDQIDEIVARGSALGASETLQALTSAVAQLRVEHGGLAGARPTIMLQSAAEIQLLKRTITEQRRTLYAGFRELLEQKARLEALEGEQVVTLPPSAIRERAPTPAPVGAARRRGWFVLLAALTAAAVGIGWYAAASRDVTNAAASSQR